MTEIPCHTCEMKSSCARDKRCLRPTSLEFWVIEVRTAVDALNAAAMRLDAATRGMNEARLREKGQQ
jgi:hypothetical protein